MTDQTGNFNDTTMRRDLENIFGVSDRGIRTYFSVTIHNEKEDFSPMKLLTRQVNRDYYKMTGEAFHVRVLMSAGDYFYRVLPFKENLEISIYKETLYENGDINEDNPPKEIRYKALLDLKSNPNMGSDSIANMRREDVDRIPPFEIVFEMLDRREEVYRLKSLDGVYSNITVEEVLKGVVPHEANKVKVDGNPIVQAVNVDPPKNVTRYPQLHIPSGTLLRDIPGFLQEASLGVYNAGLGNFFQVYKNKPTLFVYPLYDTKRFEREGVRLVIYSVPEDKFPSMDKTFRIEGKTIFIASTGEKKVIEQSRNNDINRGVGFRMSNAESFMTKPVEITDAGIKANRNRLNIEVGGYKRKDQTNYAPVVGASSNPFLEYSRFLSGHVDGVSCVWENSNEDLLYPGMPVKFIEMDKGIYVERTGTLVKSFTLDALVGSPMSSESTYSSKTNLTLFLEQKTNLPDPVEKDTDWENKKLY